MSTVSSTPPGAAPTRRGFRFPRMTMERVAVVLFASAVVTHFVVGDTQQPSAAEQRAMAEQYIAKLDPALQPMARAKLNESLAKQVAEAAKPKPAPVADREATPADLAYNRAQWEPILRQGHAAQKAFDTYVDAELAAKCPKVHEIARYGSGWSYELPTLSNSWVRASNSADLDVEVLGPSYEPKDGRYNFDFSKMRLTFDKAKVSAVIASQCAELKRLGANFYAGIDPLIAKKDFDAAYKFERRAQLWIDPLNKKLDAVITEQNPATAAAFTLAMMNGKRIK